MSRVDQHGRRPLPSPVRGEAAAPIVIHDSTKAADTARAIINSGSAQIAWDLDSYAFALQSLGLRPGRAHGSLESIAPPPRPTPGAAAAAASEASTEIHARFQAALQQVVQIYGDSRVHESELFALGNLSSRLDAVSAMRDNRALAMLPRDVRQRLDQYLFTTVDLLKNLVESHRSQLFGALVERDRPAIAERLAAPIAYKTVDLDAVTRGDPGATFRGMDRYQPGDRIAVKRSDGSTSMGIVVGRDGQDQLKVGLVEPSGAVGLRPLDGAALRERNPLKIGDYLDFGGREIWITGVEKGPPGGVVGVARDKASGATAQLSAKEVEQLSRELGDFVLARRAEGPKVHAPSSVPPPKTIGPQTLVRSGGAETVRVETVRGQTGAGGLYTSRGPNEAEHGIKYKDYNEDAAVLGVIPRSGEKPEVLFAGAFDQAGGMGQIPGKTGAASRLAAESFKDAAKEIAAGAEPEAALRAAAEKAHAEIGKLNAAHGVEAITTMASGVVRGGFATVVNAGDSQVYHYSKDGKLKNETEAHNLGEQIAKKVGDPNAGLGHSNIVTSSLGSAGSAPAIDTYKWKVEPGDYLVFVSDGVADANLEGQRKAFKAKKAWTESGSAVTAREIGELLRTSGGSAEAATEALRDFALGHMKEGRGKPDNTTAVVLRIA